VVAAWKAWNVKNEGWTSFPYPDSIGLVTVGMGNMIDPSRTSLGMTLPWTVGIGGPPASSSQVASELAAVKALFPVVQSLAAEPYSSIRLSDAAIEALVEQTIAENEAILRQSFPGWDSFPADGQAAIMSKAWAMGPGFVPADGFFNFAALVNSGQWAASIPAGHYQGGGTQERQAQEDVALANAQDVADGKGSPSTLYWPGGVTGLGTVGKASTIAGLALLAGAATEWISPGLLGPAGRLLRAGGVQLLRMWKGGA